MPGKERLLIGCFDARRSAGSACLSPSLDPDAAAKPNQCKDQQDDNQLVVPVPKAVISRSLGTGRTCLIGDRRVARCANRVLIRALLLAHLEPFATEVDEVQDRQCRQCARDGQFIVQEHCSIPVTVVSHPEYSGLFNRSEFQFHWHCDAALLFRGADDWAPEACHDGCR